MEAIGRALRSPGAMRDLVVAAPTRRPREKHQRTGYLPPTATLLRESAGYHVEDKPGLLDRGLDRVVRASGSIFAFASFQILLIAWALAGIAVFRTQLWPVLISDVQAIFSYMFDSFLMRQQLNGYNEGLHVAAELKSRGNSTHRMLEELTGRLERDELRHVVVSAKSITLEDFKLPAPNLFQKIIYWTSVIVGHIGFVIFYWITIFVWLAFGPMNDWGNQWQLNINSATSAMMIFTFSFIAILRERHADHVRACLDALYRVDSTLEIKLRHLTGDDIDNREELIPAAKVNGLQRAINYYADVVGTLVGVGILIAVMIIWLAIGPALHFNSNWWLLIGTYAGLIGLNDGFVLRNVQAKLREHEEPQYADIEQADVALFAMLDVPPPTAEAIKPTLSWRVSERMNKICGHELTVLCGVIFIVGLLIGSSVMHWTETGQLLCNVPPSIVETFFMLILITGHNSADAQRLVDLKNMYGRRLRLLEIVEAIDDHTEAGTTSLSKEKLDEVVEITIQEK